MSAGTYFRSKQVYDYKQKQPTLIGKWLCDHGWHSYKQFGHWNQYHYLICTRCGIEGPSI